MPAWALRLNAKFSTNGPGSRRRKRAIRRNLRPLRARAPLAIADVVNVAASFAGFVAAAVLVGITIETL